LIASVQAVDDQAGVGVGSSHIGRFVCPTLTQPGSLINALFVFRGGGQQSAQEGTEQGPTAASGVMHELEQGKIAGQLRLRHATVWSEPRAQQRSDPFHGMDFAEAVTILVTGILAPAVVDRLVSEAPWRQSVVDRVLIRFPHRSFGLSNLVESDFEID
jgi:hypothetical protein